MVTEDTENATGIADTSGTGAAAAAGAGVMDGGWEIKDSVLAILSTLATLVVSTTVVSGIAVS